MKNIKKDESISQLISFSKESWKGVISFCLVFSSEMSVSKAVAASYLTASEVKLKNVATFIREVDLKAFKSLKKCLDSYHRYYWEDVDWKTSRGTGEVPQPYFQWEWARHWKMWMNNVCSTPSVKMFVVWYLRDDGNSASTYLFVSPWDISIEISSLQQFWIDSAIATLAWRSKHPWLKL